MNVAAEHELGVLQARVAAARSRLDTTSQRPESGAT